MRKKSSPEGFLFQNDAGRNIIIGVCGRCGDLSEKNIKIELDKRKKGWYYSKAVLRGATQKEGAGCIKAVEVSEKAERRIKKVVDKGRRQW